MEGRIVNVNEEEGSQDGLIQNDGRIVGSEQWNHETDLLKVVSIIKDDIYISHKVSRHLFASF